VASNFRPRGAGVPARILGAGPERDTALIKRIDTAGKVTTVGKVPASSRAARAGCSASRSAADFATKPEFRVLTAADERIVGCRTPRPTGWAPRRAGLGIQKQSHKAAG